jgi:hypothetical protein
LLIRPGQDCRDDFARRVGAAVEDRIEIERRDFAVVADAGLDANLRGVADVGRANIVEIIAHEFDRPAGRGREKIHREFFDRETFRAEVAADVTRVHDELFFRQPGRDRELLAQAERRLVGRDDVHECGVVDPNQRGTRFDVAAVITRCGEHVLEHAIGCGKARVHVADLRHAVPLDVLVRMLRPLRKHEWVFLGMLVQDKRVRLQRFFGIEDPRQLFILDHDRGDGGFGNLRRVGRNRDDVFTDKAHAIV